MIFIYSENEFHLLRNYRTGVLGPTLKSKNTPAAEKSGCKGDGLHSLSSNLGPPSPPQHLSEQEGKKDFRVTAGYHPSGWKDFRSREGCEITLSKCMFGRWSEWNVEQVTQFKSWLHHLRLLPGTEEVLGKPQLSLELRITCLCKYSCLGNSMDRGS